MITLHRSLLPEGVEGQLRLRVQGHLRFSPDVDKRYQWPLCHFCQIDSIGFAA